MARAALALATLAFGLVACSADEDALPAPTSTGGATTSQAADPSSGPDGDPARAWTAEVDSQPTRALAEDDRVYVTTAGGMRFPPQIYLIDAGTGQEIERRTVTGQPYDLLIAPDGRLWIAGDRHPDQLGGAGINVHDPASLVVVDHTDLPGPAFSLAQVGEEVWVGSDGAVLALDPATLAVVRTIPVAGPAYQLLVAPDGNVLVVEDVRLELLRPDGSVAGAQSLDVDGSVVATVTPSTILLRAPVGADATVLAVDPALATAGVPVGVDTDSTGGGILATRSGAVVLVDDRRDEVLCLPGGHAPAVHVPATDLVNVLDELDDGRLVFATSTAVAVRDISC